jgi:hypothetical protein
MQSVSARNTVLRVGVGGALRRMERTWRDGLGWRATGWPGRRGCEAAERVGALTTPTAADRDKRSSASPFLRSPSHTHMDPVKCTLRDPILCTGDLPAVVRLLASRPALRPCVLQACSNRCDPDAQAPGLPKLELQPSQVRLNRSCHGDWCIVWMTKMHARRDWMRLEAGHGTVGREWTTVHFAHFAGVILSDQRVRPSFRGCLSVLWSSIQRSPFATSQCNNATCNPTACRGSATAAHVPHPASRRSARRCPSIPHQQCLRADA